MAQLTYLTQLFTGGMNSDADPASIDLTMGQDLTINEVSSVQNMLFERGLILSRPGILTASGPPVGITSSQNLWMVEALNSAPWAFNANAVHRGAVAVTIDGSNNFHLWSINCQQGFGNVFDAVEITGPGGYTPGQSIPISVAEVNGIVMLGSANSGMLHWDPTTGVYTLLNAASNFAYVTGHYARAVGAYGGPSTNLYHQTVGWSASGDETNWTSLDAGTSTLADVPDSITGIGVINGVIVLPRTYGFHLGWPTGTFPIIYNWRMYSQNSVGCMHPATFRIYQNVCYFMSDSGIHTFDMENIEDIGEGVYEELTSHIQNDVGTVVPHALIAPTYDTDWRPAYHIFLTFQGNSFPRAESPHYIYDIREKKWSRHTYTAGSLASIMKFAKLINGGIPPLQPQVVVVQQTSGVSPTFLPWTPSQVADQISSFTTGQINPLHDPTRDVQLARILVVYNTPAATSYSITATVNFILNGVAQTPVAFPFSTRAGGGWDKRWVDIRITGDFFQVQVSIPAGSPTPVKVKYIILEFTEVGKVRT